MALSGQMQFGIEHEFGLLDAGGTFLDFDTLKFEDLQELLGQLPPGVPGDGLYHDDYGLKGGRWYIEGYDRLDARGDYLATTPKGLEVRTRPVTTIPRAVAELVADEQKLRGVLNQAGLTPAVTGFNPVRTNEFVPKPALNKRERAWRARSAESLSAYRHMLTYGADVSLSWANATPDEVIDATRQLVYYAPHMVPFSFTSPFAGGKLWGGRSRRTWYRNGTRPAALAHLEEADMVAASPSLTKIAPIPGEVGRIEFKAFDSVADLTLYGGLLALVKGVILSPELTGRADVPDSEALIRASETAWSNEADRAASRQVLDAAAAALPSAERKLLAPLRAMLETASTPADHMIRAYNKGEPIQSILRSQS